MSLSTVEQITQIRQGRTLVFTNGVFDILHAGHVTYLELARSLGDLLVVGLNSDDSVRKLGKGKGRPINTLEDRATVIAALRCVSGVVAFDEDTPIALLEKLRPEIHTKGGDYAPQSLPETPLVESYGGKVVVLPFLEGRSTTTILRKLMEPELTED